ncbi:hypothetical protein HGRIS_000625 [Hohenbuehelia grisea]|uniref:Uncharacterized protein n=1 Tax=Hohenbuehelia grisea TaxID=104357 RepID=A0ABR3JSY3_9AGAR
MKLLRSSHSSSGCDQTFFSTVDPLSIASSIITFIDGANKLKKTFFKIPQSHRRLKQIQADVLRELEALERFCRSRFVNMVPEEAAEIKSALAELQSDLVGVQQCCKALLGSESHGVLASMAAPFKRRAVLESNLCRLEKSIHACQFRFMLFSSIRTEFNVVTNHQENLDRLEHIDELVSYMLLRNHRTDSFLFRERDEPDDIDMRFLSHQIRKLLQRSNSIKTQWKNVAGASSQQTCKVAEIVVLWSPGAEFRNALMSVLDALRMSLYNLRTCAEQNLAVLLPNAVAFTWSLIIPLRPNGIVNVSLCDIIICDLLRLAGLATEFLHALHSANECDSYSNMLAFCRLCAARIYTYARDSRALEASEQAVDDWNAIYDRQKDTPSLLHNLTALNYYRMNVRKAGRFEEALDLSLQALLLLRTTAETQTLNDTMISWEASGEANVVFSPQRRISRSSTLIALESGCLWHVANNLASVGRYAEARVAGLDAISCRSAYERAYPSNRGLSTIDSCLAIISTWVSPLNLDMTELSSTSSVEEIDDSSPSSPTPSHALSRTTTSWSSSFSE